MGKRRIALVMAICMMVVGCMNVFPAHAADVEESKGVRSTEYNADYYLSEIQVDGVLENNVEKSITLKAEEEQTGWYYSRSWYMFQADASGDYWFEVYESSERDATYSSVYELMPDANSLVFVQGNWYANDNGSADLIQAKANTTYYVQISGSSPKDISAKVKVSKADVPSLKVNTEQNAAVGKLGQMEAHLTVSESGYYNISASSEALFENLEIEEFQGWGYLYKGGTYYEEDDRQSEIELLMYLQKGRDFILSGSCDQGDTIAKLRVEKQNCYEYYDYAQCMSFLASGGSINYVGYSKKTKSFSAGIREGEYIKSGQSWEFNTDHFKNPKEKWTPVRHLWFQYEPDGKTYDFAYNSLKAAEDIYQPLVQLYTVKDGNVFAPVAVTDKTAGGDEILIARFQGTEEGMPKAPDNTNGTEKPSTQNPPTIVQASGVKLNYAKITMRKNTRFKWLKASVLPENASNKAIVWKSSNTKVAVVDAKGNIRAKKAGKTVITATTVNGKTAKVSVKVVGSRIRVSKLHLEQKKVTLKKGKKLKLRVTILPVNADNRKVTWKSSNKKVASINAKGVVKAKKPGKVKITCTSRDKGRKKAVCTITVKK